MNSRTIVVVACFLIAGSLESCMKAPAVDDRPARNTAIMMKAYDVFMGGNVNMLDSLIARDMVEHNPVPGITSTGLAAVKEFAMMYKTAFPDMKVHYTKVMADSEYVIVYYTMTGTNTGPMMGMAACNKPVTVDGVDLVRIKDGLCVEHWGISDEMTMMKQLGMMPQHDMADMKH